MNAFDDFIDKLTCKYPDLQGLEYHELKALDDIGFIQADDMNSLANLLNHADFVVQFTAANLLTSWGAEDGLDYIQNYIAVYGQDSEAGTDNVSPHRIRQYDQSCEEILDSLISFRLHKEDQGEPEKGAALTRQTIKRIIRLSAHHGFEIQSLYDFILIEKTMEFDSELKEHFLTIAKDSQAHHYKYEDAIGFFKVYDPDFYRRIQRPHS